MFKHFPKLLIYFFILVFIIQIACLIVLLVIPQPGQAADFTPQVTIPNSGFTKDKPHTMEASTKPIGDYVQAIYNYSIGIVGILATVVLMFGGVMWITAGGNAERTGSAKAWIGAALSGLVLTLCSYVILNTINPDLVNLKIRTIAPAKPPPQTTTDLNFHGCCELGTGSCGNTTQSNCPTNSNFLVGYSCEDDICVKPILGCCFVPQGAACMPTIKTQYECNNIPGTVFMEKYTCRNGNCVDPNSF